METDGELTVAELAIDIGAHPDDVRMWAQALIPIRGVRQVYRDTLYRVLLAPDVVATIRTEGFLTL